MSEPVKVESGICRTGLVVVEPKCVITGLKGEICIEGSTIEEVQGVDSREMVLKQAQKMGLNRPGFSGGGSTEWVNKAGESIRGESFHSCPLNERRVQITYPVQAGI